MDMLEINVPGTKRTSNNPLRGDFTMVHVNDFGDEYHLLDNEPKTDLDRQVRKIRRRYKSFYDYRAALCIYDEYMDELEKKHEGDNSFKLRLATGKVFEYIPPQPKLKKNPLNNFIMQNDVVLSNCKTMKVNSDMMTECENISEDINVETTKISDKIKRGKDNREGQIIDELVNKSNTSKNMLSMDTMDALTMWLNKNTDSKEVKKEEKEKSYSVTDIINDNCPEEEDDTVVFYKGRHVTQKEANELSFINNMNSFGWNSLKIMKGLRKSGEAGGVVASVLIQQETDRKREKLKKKNNKKSKSTHEDDEFLIKIMGDNDNFESFGEFEDEMLDYTVNNIFK